MDCQTNASHPWGKYRPRGRDHLLLLIRKLGLSHGPVKKIVGRLWLSRHPNDPVDVRYHGMKFRLHPWDNAIESKMLFGSGQRERPELKVLKAGISGGGEFLDIGANIGYYSLMAAGFGSGRILAIEPNPIVYARLKFNIFTNHLDDRISALPVALGEQTQESTLLIAEGDLGGSRIGETKTPGKAIAVSMKPLAQVLAEEGIERVGALKIDVEGMEDKVLLPFYQGTPSSIWPRVVIIEDNPQQWQKDIVSWLIENGYKLAGKTRSNSILQLV